MMRFSTFYALAVVVFLLVWLSAIIATALYSKFGAPGVVAFLALWVVSGYFVIRHFED